MINVWLFYQILSLFSFFFTCVRSFTIGRYGLKRRPLFFAGCRRTACVARQHRSTSSPASSSSRRPRPCSRNSTGFSAGSSQADTSGDAMIGGFGISTLCSTVRARRRTCGMTCSPAGAAVSKVSLTMRSELVLCRHHRLNRWTAAPHERRRQAADGRHQSFVLFTCRATHWKLYPHQRRRRHLIGRKSEEATSTSKVGTAPSPLTWLGTPTNARC